MVFKFQFCCSNEQRTPKAPSDEGSEAIWIHNCRWQLLHKLCVSEADWGREKAKTCNTFLSLRPFGAPPSSEGGRGAPAPVQQHDKQQFDRLYYSKERGQGQALPPHIFSDYTSFPARYTRFLAKSGLQTTKSATLPGLMEPTSLWTPSAAAGFSVQARMAASTGIP